MQKDNNNVLKWIIIIVLVIVLSYVSGLVSEMLDINTRSARYLVLLIVFLGWYIVDTIRNKKK